MVMTCQNEVVLVKTRALVLEDATNRRVDALPNGEFIFQGDRILEVGTNLTRKVDRVLDWSDSLVSPGFIDLNALGDIDHHLIYCEQDRPEKLNWSIDYLKEGPVEAMTAEEEAFKSLFAYTQLLRRGVTTIMPITCTYYKKAGETYEELVAAAKNAVTLGMRAYLGMGFIGKMHCWDTETQKRVTMPLESEGREGFENAKRFATEYDGYGHGLINTIMCPERIELQTEDILKETSAFAKEHGFLIRLHAAQGAFEYNLIQKLFGMSSVKYLDSIGLLNDHFLISHALYTSGSTLVPEKGDSDLEILSQRGVSVIHCPLVYGRSGRGLQSFARFRRFGIKLAMGSDTFPPDPFMNMRAGSMFAYAADPQANHDNDFEAFWYAYTAGGADVLKRSDLGRIAQGCKADFFRIPLNNVWLGTVENPIRTLAMAATGLDVSDVYVDGQPVVARHAVLNVSTEGIQQKAEQYHEKLKESFRARSPLKNMDPFWQ